jgi:hypothetical protein
MIIQSAPERSAGKAEAVEITAQQTSLAKPYHFEKSSFFYQDVIFIPQLS